MRRAQLCSLAVLSLWSGLTLWAAGCGDSKSGGLFSNKTSPTPPRGSTSSQASAATSALPLVMAYREEDFIETDRSRDPFRSFAPASSAEALVSARSQRDVLLDRYSVDELKLVGIVTGGAEARAMLVDPTGKGWIVKRGQFVGKAELVHSTGPNSADYELNWRVDRIREGDLVLIREDPAHSDIPPATRVIPLRPEESESGPAQRSPTAARR